MMGGWIDGMLGFDWRGCGGEGRGGLAMMYCMYRLDGGGTKWTFQLFFRLGCLIWKFWMDLRLWIDFCKG